MTPATRTQPSKRTGLAAGWIAAVAFILLPDHFPWLATAGWTFAAWRILKNPYEGLLLLAFFTPLFTNFGVLPIGYDFLPVHVPPGPNQNTLSLIFFSVKPVQLITLLLIAALAWRKTLFFKDPLDWLAVGSLIGIWAISLLAGAYSDDPLKSFRVNINFALLIVLCKVLMSMIDRRETLWSILHFYFLGLMFLCAVHLVNYFGDMMLFRQETRFNNHFGFLLSMSFPLGLCMLFTTRGIPGKAWYLGVLLAAFFCTVLTLSRTSLLGAVTGMLIFMIVLFARSPWELRRRILRLAAIALVLVAASALIYDHLPGTTDATSLFRRGQYDSGKLTSLVKMFRPSYMRHALFEDPNGGMFGERFVQLRSVKEVFLSHWLFGEGWTNRVISYHGLYYTILTGTGLLGFSLFLFFLYRMLRALWRAPLRDPDPITRVLAIALFCSLLDWMLHSLMDTYFLQFHIWLFLAMSLAYIKWVLRQRALAGD